MGLKRNLKGELTEVTPLRTRKGSVYIKGINEKFKISRSKFSSFLDCKRCFYIQNRLGIKMPKMFPFKLNSLVDTKVKQSFDVARKKQEQGETSLTYKIARDPRPSQCDLVFVLLL